MTPELKIACEVVFQEHKISTQPIKWDKDAFRGRISIGLSAMAKETLVKKNIILLPNKAKKVFTQLNPDVASADSFEEAEKIIVTKVPALVSSGDYDANKYIDDHVYGFTSTPAPIPQRSYHFIPAAKAPEIKIDGMKWYMKPLFLYLVWPVCGAAGGIGISMLMELTVKAFF